MGSWWMTHAVVGVKLLAVCPTFAFRTLAFRTLALKTLVMQTLALRTLILWTLTLRTKMLYISRSRGTYPSDISPFQTFALKLRHSPLAIYPCFVRFQFFLKGRHGRGYSR